MDNYLSEEQIHVYLEELTANYGYQLYMYAVRLTGNVDDAKDLVQDALFKAYQHVQMKPVPFPNALAWFYQVIRHRHIDHLRSRSSKTDSLDMLHSSCDEGQYVRQQKAFVDTDHVPEVLVEQKVTLEQVTLEIQSLPPGGVRDALLLCCEGIDSPREIAERTGQSYNTARSNMSRGRKLLRTRLTAWSSGEQEL